MKIIFYELNEISYELFKEYANKYNKSSFAEFINQGFVRETICKDDGELSPWISWPTLHTGVGVKKHKFRYLNQDIQTNYKYPPIWDMAAKKGFSIGIFGLLQSRLKKENINNYKFFIPDTFNLIDESKPKRLNSFQRLNTFFVSRLRTNKSSINISLLKIFIRNLKSRNITLKGLIIIIKQLVSEIIYKSNKFYRTITQAELSYLLFKNLLAKYSPDLAIFFTNHLASSMHRYLKFKNLNNRFFIPSNVKNDAVLVALHSANKQLKNLMNFAKQNDYEVLLASSIGQDLIESSNYNSYTISNFERFSKKISKNQYPVEFLPAMYPDIILKFEKRENLIDFQKQIKEVSTIDKNNLFDTFFPESGHLTLNIKFVYHSIKLETEKKSIKEKYLSKNILFDGKIYKIDDFGISIFNRGYATAYHIPEGILALTNYSKKTKKLIDSNFKNKQSIDIRKIPNLIIKLLEN